MTELTATNALSGVLARKDVTLSDALGALVKAPEPLTGVLETPLPKKPALSKAAEQAMLELPELLRTVPVPETARRLTEAELAILTRAIEGVKSVKGAVTKAEEKLKPAFHNHFNAVARENGRVKPDTKANDHGYILEDEDSAFVPGLPKKVVRQTSKGGVSFGEQDLATMEGLELIDHALYLELTRPIRVLDEHAFMERLKNDPTFAAKVAPFIHVSDGNTSLNLKAND
jgi:hypothetical protein